MNKSREPRRNPGEDEPAEGRMLSEQASPAAPVWHDDLIEFPQSNCCCSHDWPYFRQPVHPYDYSRDWNLEDEWARRKEAAARKIPKA